jgi:hypothetical protein
MKLESSSTAALPGYEDGKLTFGGWKRWKGETHDDAGDVRKRDRRSPRSGRGRTPTPIAQRQGAELRGR